MPGFNRSLLKVLDYQPYTTDAQGNVTATLDGVFILFSNALVSFLKSTLTQAQKDELQTWVASYTEAQCATWHVPVWAGNSSAVYCRVPATVWASPADPVPQKVRDYFQSLFA